jgi:autotransporter-associated beta strand protein
MNQGGFFWIFFHLTEGNSAITALSIIRVSCFAFFPKTRFKSKLPKTMKSKHSSFRSLFAIVITVGLAPAYAATIDTTGNTIGTPALLANGNTYIGDGFLTAPAGPDIALLDNQTTLSMSSGGLFTIESGVKVTTFRAFWTNNKADLQLDGTLDLWDNDKVAFVDALTGTGSIVYGTPWNDRMWVHVGMDNGSGTFSGTVQSVHFTGNGVQMTKSGTGTQTFDNLANQPFKNLMINEGVVDLKNATDVTVAFPVIGAGNLTKSGAGVLTLNGTISTTGDFTVSEGTVQVGSNLTSNVNVVIASGAVMNLTAVSTVDSLKIAGSGPLPAGTYNSTHPTYGSSFIGAGALVILPPTGPNDGTWSLASSGNWSDFSKWELSTVANAAGKIATFKAASPVTVTLDSNRSLGQLVFEQADHTLAGSPGSTLMLNNDGFMPSVTVAAGRQARITSLLTSTMAVEKLGDGTLTIASGSSISSGTLINAGKLVLENNTSGGPSFMIEEGTTLELAFLSGGARTLSNGTIQGGGNLVKTGNSTAYLGANGQVQSISLGATSLIDVQAGLLRNEYGNGNWGANQSDLNVVAGASFDIWDASVRVDAITGSGLINKAWSGTHSLTFGVADGTGSFSGTISNTSQSYGGAGGGTLNLVKIGTGTQTFTGMTPFKGSLAVSAGTLSLGNGTANTSLSDANSVTVETDAILNLNFTVSDTVASVSLGGTTYTTPGATFGASNFPAFFTGTGTLKIAGTDFDNWVTETGVVGGPAGDDDNDGLSNFEEYAFGLVPTSGSSVNPFAVPFSKATGTFSYTRRNSALTAPLAYSVWYSTDLVGWTQDTGAIQGTPVLVGNVQTVPMTVSAGLLTNPKLFIQLRAQ